MPGPHTTDTRGEDLPIYTMPTFAPPAPTMSQERPETLDDVRLWIAEHDGRINAWWRTQKDWNARTDDRLADCARRITVVERRIIYFAGFSAGIGALLGGVLPHFFGL